MSMFQWRRPKIKRTVDKVFWKPKKTGGGLSGRSVGSGGGGLCRVPSNAPVGTGTLGFILEGGGCLGGIT